MLATTSAITAAPVDKLSWNCGVEGPTDDPAIEALRNRQVKNFFALELLAAGTPMLLMGDEVRRTQRGNNNAYCQDGEINWFDWSLRERHADVHRFVKELNAFRQTALASPDQISTWAMAPAVLQATYVAQPRFVVVLALALPVAGE